MSETVTFHLIRMSSSLVSKVAGAYPTRSEWHRVFYDPPNLCVPDDLMSKVFAVLAEVLPAPSDRVQ